MKYDKSIKWYCKIVPKCFKFCFFPSVHLADKHNSIKLNYYMIIEINDELLNARLKFYFETPSFAIRLFHYQEHLPVLIGANLFHAKKWLIQ